MKLRILILGLFVLFSFINGTSTVFGLGGEYTGQFDAALVANVEDEEDVIFKFDTGERLQDAGKFDATAHFTTAKLLDPRTEQYTVTAYLVEEKSRDPAIFVDVNDDRRISPDEKYILKRNPDDTYIWNTTISLPLKDGLFKTCPIFIRYLKSYVTSKMTHDDRLIMQSTQVLARGQVKVKGKNVLVQYAYNIRENAVNPQNGLLGIDADENGEIDMANLSAEAAKAHNELVVFRIGDLYLSTKKVDVAKNQIVLRENDAKEYKRIEVSLNKDFPDFPFTDFEGKKHRLTDFKGKYILLDIWGFWCGPCRREIPYIREAYRRFQSRGLEVIGLNTDEDYSVEAVKKGLKDNQMTWNQAQFQSIRDFIGSGGLRVNSFPTTFLISPDGKILSMGRPERNEPDLRGKDLLTTLDEILPKP